MGIKGLETFIAEHPEENIARDVNIRDEIKRWRKKYNTKPTIVIYLNHFVQILANIETNLKELILGGRYAAYNQEVKSFFDELKACGANLAFFCQPFMNHMKEYLISQAFKSVERQCFTNFLRCNNKLNKRIFFPWHLDKRFLYNLVNICSNYGPVYTQIAGLYARITEYAADPSNRVLAMIQHDNHYLLHDGDYQYWTLIDLDLKQFTTKKYCRDTLYQRLRLTNTQECRLLAGITMVRCKGYKRFCQEKILIVGKDSRDNAFDFFKWAHYVRNLRIGTNGWNQGHLKRIVNDIYCDKNVKFELKFLEMQLSRYSTQIENELYKVDHNLYFVKFCSENLHFAYGLIMEDISSNQSLAFIDRGKEDSGRYINDQITILLKQCGILLKDHGMEERPRLRLINFWQGFGEDGNGRKAEIIYPSIPLPRLENLIMHENDTTFDASRWSLFGWILELDDERISAIKTSVDSKFMRIVLFTLKYLRKRSFITTLEAAVILLTESEQSQSSKYPLERYDVNGQRIHTAHKYTITFETVCHCLEICGLRKETDLIQFNAFEFHRNMIQAEQNPGEFANKLKRIQNIRKWF